MKYLICSDIHGDVCVCEKILAHFDSMNCDKLLLLGDVLYHGPRNDLPQGYAPKQVIELLNQYADSIIACRGNCDAEVDQKVLKFSIMNDSFTVKENGFNIFGSHGHIYAPLNSDGVLPFNCEDAEALQFKDKTVFLYGHTHISVLEKRNDNLVICNPGSPSIPKGNTMPGFAILEDNSILLFDLNGAVIKVLAF